MSKSRGTGLDPLKYLSLGMNPEWLRYYIATKLTAKNEDIEFSPEDFMARVNSDLIGKYVNIASRAAGFLAKHFDGQMGDSTAEVSHPIVHTVRAAASQIAQSYSDRDYAKALRRAMELADEVNSYYDNWAPWKLAKSPKDSIEFKRLQRVCSHVIECFRLLTIFLKPVPKLSR